MEAAEGKSVDVSSDIKKKGRALLIYDLKQRKLIPTKALFFVVLSSIGVLLPYMTIHMKSLGISVQETAMIHGIFPLFAIFAPYTMGIIADKLGNFKVLLSVTMLLAMATALLFLVIPTGRFVDKYPVNLSLAVGCYENSHALLTDLDSKTCGFQTAGAANLSLTVSECGYICYDEIHQHSNRDTKESLPADWPSADQPYKKFRNGLFFKETWSLDYQCLGRNCTFGRSEKMSKNVTFSDVVLKLNGSEGTFLVERMDHLQCNTYDQPVKLVRPLVYVLKNNLRCDEGALGQWTDGEEPTESRIVYRVCRPQCIAQTKRKLVCNDDENVIVFDPQLTFWVYLLLRIFFAIFLGGAKVLFEGACVAVVIEYKGDLGLQRMFGILGTMIFSPVSGALIDHFSVDQNIPDYRPAFYLYGILAGTAAFGMLTVDLDFKPPAKQLIKDIKNILSLELGVFFLVIFTSGLFWGYIESYLFWFLEEMGGTKSLMGLTVTISSATGIPALLLSDTIFRRIGHPNVQIIGFVVYIVRLVGYSYIYTPYMCLIYEAMEAVTTSLMITSAIAYSAELSSTTTLATVQGLIAGTYYGIGRGAGSFVGGFLMKSYGTRTTFRILGVAAAFVALFYFLFNIFYIRRRRLAAEKLEKKMMPEKTVKPNDVCGEQGGLSNPVFVQDDDVTKSAVSSSAREGKSINLSISRANF